MGPSPAPPGQFCVLFCFSVSYEYIIFAVLHPQYAVVVEAALNDKMSATRRQIYQ